MAGLKWIICTTSTHVDNKTKYAKRFNIVDELYNRPVEHVEVQAINANG